MERRFFLLAGAALLAPQTGFAQPHRPPRRPRGDRGPDRGPGRGPDRGPGGGSGRSGPGGRPQKFSWHGHSYNSYHGPAFRYPPGYGYRRWGIGAVLPGLLFSQAYFWDDWRLLGVPAPRPGRRWVRYGPDLLLVNIRTRRIEDVIYGAFF